MARRNLNAKPDYYRDNDKNVHKLGKKDVKKRVKARKEARKVKVKRVRLTTLLTIAVYVSLSFLIVNKQVMLDKSSKNVEDLKKEYNAILTETQQLQLQIDRSTDLKTLEEIATNKLGMIKPERYQIFYIDTRMSDYAEKLTSAKEEKPTMSGVPGLLVKSIGEVMRPEGLINEK